MAHIGCMFAFYVDIYVVLDFGSYLRTFGMLLHVSDMPMMSLPPHPGTSPYEALNPKPYLCDILVRAWVISHLRGRKRLRCNFELGSMAASI